MQKDMQYWAGHVAAIACEGIFVSTYAKRESLSLASLYYWRRKLGAAAPEVAAQRLTSPFVRLRVAERAANHGSAVCALELATGMRLELFDLPSPDWLVRLARAATEGY